MPLDPYVRELATGANYAIVSTHMPDDSIQSAPVWIDADDDHLLINTEIHRQRFVNLQRDPRVTVLIVRGTDWYDHVEVRGHMVEGRRGPAARTHIDDLARRYTGADYANPIQSERVIVVVEPDRQRRFPPA